MEELKTRSGEQMAENENLRTEVNTSLSFSLSSSSWLLESFLLSVFTFFPTPGQNGN